VGDERRGVVERQERLTEERVVVVEAAPALAIEAVRDVVLRDGITPGGIGPREGGPRLAEAIGAKGRASLLELGAIDLVEADRGAEAARHLADRPWPLDVQPDHERGVGGA